MASISDIKQLGDELLPLIKDLFSRARSDKTKEDTSGELNVIRKLKKVMAEAGQETAATLNERVEAIVASHTALTELLIETANSHFSPDQARLNAVRVQRRALDDTLGDVLVKETFKPIKTLLDKDHIARIEKTIIDADSDIAARAEAKAILDQIIGIATSTASIATKLAAV